MSAARTPREPARGQRLLLVFAHPDDESFFCAGTVAGHVAAWGEAALICATRGERGSQPTPPVCQPGELGRVRSEELTRACRAMGIGRLTFLSYEDGRLAEADPGRAVASLVREVEVYRPAAIVTFGPDGIYQHPDHVAIHRLTLAAYEKLYGPPGEPAPPAAPKPPRLWYVALPSAFWRYRPHVWTADPADREKAPPPAAPAGEARPEAAIDISRTLGKKIEALLAHRTQRHNVERAFSPLYDFEARAARDEDALATLGREYFALARGPRPSRTLETSLFEDGYGSPAV